MALTPVPSSVLVVPPALVAQTQAPDTPIFATKVSSLLVLLVKLLVPKATVPRK
jgi:hypothetical protein